MSEKNPSRPDGAPEGTGSQRMTLEEFKALAQEAEGHPEQVRALVKRLVLETLDEVSETLEDDDSEPA